MAAIVPTQLPPADLAALLSPDNETRNRAEQQLTALQESSPAQLALHLVDALACPTTEPVVRELCAVLLRRRLPVMLPALVRQGEWFEAVKSKLLQALSSECDGRLRRKTCEAVGRLGIELFADNMWPELMEFIRAACASGVPTAHEAALTVLSHMAPALVEPKLWPTVGRPLQEMLISALGQSAEGGVSGAALAALAALLSACAEQERDADDAAEKKRLKAVASDLEGSLPPMLSVLQAAVNAADPARITAVMESLSAVASAQPRLFKPVLQPVVDGMAQLAVSAELQFEARISCAELLLTLAEGAPKMCARLESFVPRVLEVLLPMLVRLGGDLDDWEAAEPTDGLLDTDNDEDEEKEAAYAAEALDRLCCAMEAEGVTRLMLPQLQAMLGGGAPWTSRHAALVAIATVCESSSAVLEPHLAGLVELLRSSAAAPEPRLRWASFYAVGLLCDEFGQMAESMHPTLVPLLAAGMADASARVRAAACLAAVNLIDGMEQDVLGTYTQPLLGGVHGVVSAANSAGYVVFAAAQSLSRIAESLADAPAKPMGAAYAAFMPLLAQRLPGAIDSRYGELAAALLSAMGNLAAACPAEQVAADVASLIPNVVSLLARREVAEDRPLLRSVHTALTCLAPIATAAFVPHLDGLLPALLAAAVADVDFQMEQVEAEDPAADEEDGWEVEYHQNRGKGLLKVRINAAQMDEKIMALEALYTYAHALGATFHPAVPSVVESCLPLLTYRWSDRVRAAAATALPEAYKCVVLAAAAGAGGLSKAHALEVSSSILKPITDQLAKEDSLVTVDALLEALREVTVLERTHQVGALNGAALNGVLQVLKRQLQLDEGRVKARAAAAAERDDDEEADDDDDLEEEAELLTTCAALTAEVVRQHGASCLPQVEAQLLPHIQSWLAPAASPTEDEAALVRLALGIDVVGAIMEHAGRDAGKKYVAAVLPLLQQHGASGDVRLRRSVYKALGIVAEHSGKLLTRANAVAVAKLLTDAIGAPDARYAANVSASEAAAAALGKMLVHRSGAVDAASVVPVWLAWLPLRHAEEDECRAAVECLCKLLEADAHAVFGADGATFPLVLGAMAAAYESEAAGEAASARMKALVVSWTAANQAMVTSGAGMIPQPHLREKVGRMATA